MQNEIATNKEVIGRYKKKLTTQQEESQSKIEELRRQLY